MSCPQGSCSGPTLWNLVTNEILKETWPENTAIRSFADDFVIVSHAPTKIKIENQIHASIEKFINWANKNKLQISTGQTQYILFSKLTRLPRIRWQGETIQRKHTIKYLGLLIGDILNWNAHLRNLSIKSFTLYQNLLKIIGENWEFSLKLRRMLYKTVIERMLAYGAAVWCLDPSVRIRRKLNTIKRPFLLVLTGAYRTTATLALQVILEILPLYLQLRQEARLTAIRRLNISLPDTLTTLIPREVEKGETGWATHPAECPSEEQISLVDDGGITSGTRIYMDGSKTEKGVGAAFCVWSGQNIVCRWLAKLQHCNTVFQAELLALKHATDHAISLPHQTITILVDNQASVQAAANPRSINTTAREICKSLITNKHIHISWIKAHVGYDGNEEVDRLAKEAAESDRGPLSAKSPISFLKSVFKKK
ncbi:Retrovirus-related Pol polyprotein from type-1 retrotransposable element R1 [Araneus ventricosus]|uniref:Retrovirus-related Pol polyprotein from type-1 retrotransposable element R1 n=1 Tax=Araneus ventricosus TaxID=182803 RepID=A0A4Y2PT08_ARAVE|nr:Retrovirus-related Pol polyprotein from type-1 retrotransposable element R1 [Araneus ventricosus]